MFKQFNLFKQFQQFKQFKLFKLIKLIKLIKHTVARTCENGLQGLEAVVSSYLDKVLAPLCEKMDRLRSEVSLLNKYAFG